MEAETRRTISVEEAANFLGIGRSYGYLLARKGQLPGVFKIGNRYRVSTKILFDYIEVWSTEQESFHNQEADSL